MFGQIIAPHDRPQPGGEPARASFIGTEQLQLCTDFKSMALRRFAAIAYPLMMSVSLSNPVNQEAFGLTLWMI